MPAPVSGKSARQLLESLDVDALQKSSSFKQLNGLLQQSDIDLAGVNTLQTESDSVVKKIVNKFKDVWDLLSTGDTEQPVEYKVYRRETPILSTRIPASVPLWANGAKAAYSMGPYLGIDGRQFWFDFYVYEKLIPVSISGDTAPVMLLPLKISILRNSALHYTVGKGSIWMRADLFAAGLSKTQYIGINVDKGDLSFTTAHPVTNNTITIAAADSFDLQVALNNTFAPVGTGAEGIDAREASVLLPETAHFKFSAGKFSLSEIAQSGWTLYGDKRIFNLQQAPATFNAFLNRLVFPLTTDAPVFTASSCKSQFFSISGETAVISSGWCLSVAAMDTSKPFAVGNNGALALLGKPGLSYRWKGLNLQANDVQMNVPLIMAEPGKFSVSDAVSLFKAHTEDYQLWERDKDSGVRTTVSLSLKKNLPFLYYCDEAGTEMVSAWADADLKTDKPYKADGTSVAPKTIDSLYFKYITPTLRGIYLYDLDMVKEMTPDFKHQQKPEIYQFAITNAYMITTPPASILLTGIFDDTNNIVKGNLYITYGLFKLTPTLPHPYTTNYLNDDTFIGVEKLLQVDDVKQWNALLINLVMSSCIWEDAAGGEVTVDFELLTELFKAVNNQPAAVTDQVLTSKSNATQLFAAGTKEEQPVSPAEFLSLQGRQGDLFFGRMYSLLDLSTWYDLFGISMAWNNQRFRGATLAFATNGANNEVTIEKMNLEAPMALLRAFTLPHIAWEPLYNLTQPDTPADPVQGVLSFPDNGLPSLFSQPDPKPVVIDPLQHLLRFKENLSATSTMKGSNIIFSLPHGKLSLALLSYFDPKYATVKGNLDFIQPSFSSAGKPLKGGMQFRMASSTESGRHRLPGMTNQLRNVIYPNGVQQNISILGESVHTIFQNDFFKNYVTDVPEIKADGVPVTHIDFSGYGASMFSDWLQPDAVIAQTSEVRFDVLLGRVSHEVVQVVSIVYPWGIKVVRTITFHRNANAVIFREDSGWVAQSDGLFDFSFKGDTAVEKNKQFPNPYAFHPGLIGGLFNVHNIKELDEEGISIPYVLTNDDYGFESQFKQVIEHPSGTPSEAVFKAVSFDANVQLEDIISGGANGRVTGRQFKGYVQLSPPGVPVPPGVLAELFQRQQNAIGGSVDCIMKIGGSDQTLKINRIDACASYQQDNPANRIFVVAAKGSVQLPAEGSWSIVEVDKGSGEVSPVSNKESVPVIRKGERGREKAFVLNGNDNIVKIGFADSLVNNAGFKKRFGYLQNTGSQKMLLTDPRVDQNTPQQLLSEAPLLADAYRLLNSKAPFPNLANVFTIENVTDAVTDILPKGLVKKIIDFPVPDDLSFDIIGKDEDPLHMYIQYESEPKGGKTKTLVNYITDSSIDDLDKKFKNELSNLNVVVDMGPFKKLLTISGDFKAGSSIDPSMDSGNAPQLKLCKELQPIYDILEFLANLDPSNPVDAVKKALKVAMSNTADSWEYKFKAEKEIPIVRFPFDAINYNSPTTPLKLDAYFRIGCYYNQPVKIPNAIDQLVPSSGSYLELGADLRVMCFSLAAATVYATGRAQVGLAADIKSGPNLYFKFGFGIELCVGLPVVGSVSVMYLVGVDMNLNTESLTIGAFMYFRGRAEILGGIVTITIQIEASGKIQKQLAGGPCNCLATCTFAIDISIFLVINISFSETWGETRQIA